MEKKVIYSSVLTYNDKLVTHTHIYIYIVLLSVRPTLFTVNGPDTVIDEGSVQTLTCTADGGKPPPLVQWHLLGKPNGRSNIKLVSLDPVFLLY